MVGLGRMGGNMVLRLLKRGHRMVAFDLSPDAVKRHTCLCCGQLSPRYQR